MSLHLSPSPLPDPVGEALHLLRLTGTLYCRAELSAPWGMVLPDMSGSLFFAILTSGQGWLKLPEGEPIQLKPGSMVLLPQGSGALLYSDPRAEPVPLFDIPVEKISERYEIMRYGGEGDITRATAGFVQFDHYSGQRLIGLLPPVVYIDAWNETAGQWLHSTLGLIAAEATALRPGGETVMTRLADILIIQAIRAWLDALPTRDSDDRAGWLKALRDPRIGRALMLMHRSTGHNWSLAELADKAGMSRSAFSARFSTLVGQPVMQYLSQLRLHQARADLMTGNAPISRIAETAGYSSEAAFGRAFKALFGCSASTLRRQTRPQDSA